MNSKNSKKTIRLLSIFFDFFRLISSIHFDFLRFISIYLDLSRLPFESRHFQFSIFNFQLKWTKTY
jgi:hypothetical protein